MVFYNHKGKILNYDSFGIENVFKEIRKFIKTFFYFGTKTLSKATYP